MHIYSTDENLVEIETDLHQRDITTERYILAYNSADAGGTDIQIVSVAAGAAIALIAQVLSAFINRKTGQRKIVFKITDPEKDEIIHIEVESPRLEEIESLLNRSYEVHLIDSKADQKKTEQDAAANP